MVDLTQIEQATVSLAASALGILGSAALYKLRQRFGQQVIAAQRSAFDDALSKSITYGATLSTPLIASKGWQDGQVHAAVIELARYHAETMFPDTMKGVGFDALTAALQRTLPAAMAAAAASPATPPANPPADPST